MPRGIVIVDHGSRLAASNVLLEDVVNHFAARFPHYAVVEAAHMELSEPSIATAYDRCVARGADEIIVAPYFLGPGRHWQQDIPRLTASAAAQHPGTRFHVAPPLGLDDLLLDLLEKRIQGCVTSDFRCPLCEPGE